MAIVEGWFEEIGFFESECSRFEWVNSDLIVYFSKGVDVGGSSHPLADSFLHTDPCKIKLRGVVKSILKVSQAKNNGTSFDVRFYEKDNLPTMTGEAHYHQYHIEGMMWATDPCGWFSWEIVAETNFLDDLKE